MINTEEHLGRIREKLKRLLKQYAILSKENSKLKADLELAGKKNVELLKHKDELRQQVSVLKAAAGQMNEEDRKEFEKRINGYLKEIDRCIALLGE